MVAAAASGIVMAGVKSNCARMMIVSASFAPSA
jgi:hypothetical protein